MRARLLAAAAQRGLEQDQLAKRAVFWHVPCGALSLKEGQKLMKRLALCTTAAMALSATGTLAAQNADEVNGADISLSLGSVYDTNRLRLEEGVAPPPGGSEDDLITSAEASLDLSYKTGLQRVFLEGTAGYVWHRDNTFLDNEKIDLTAGLDWGLTSRCGGILSARVERRQTDLADLDAVVDNTRETETYTGTAGCYLRSNWYAEGGADYIESSNSNGAQRTDDLEAFRFGGKLEYSPNETSTYGLSYSDTDIDYPNLGAPTVDIVVIEATAKRRFGNSLKLDAALGHSDAEPGDGPFTPDFAGTTGHLAAELNPSSRLSVSSAYNRGIGYSSDVSADFFLRDRIAVAANFEVTPIIGAEISARRIERDFYSNLNFRPLVRSYDETDAVRGAIHYRLRKQLKVTAGVERLERETDGPRGTYDSTQIFVSLGVTR
jgi:hypothetical protein